AEDCRHLGPKDRCGPRPVGQGGPVPEPQPGAPIGREPPERTREADPPCPRARENRSQRGSAVGGAGPGRSRLARILRGEVYWADLNPVRGREQAGLRPVLILSHDLFNRKSETVIAMAITSQAQQAGFPLTMALPAEMMPKAS